MDHGAVRTFLGVDGGGSKTEFVLIEDSGRVLARHTEGSAYYLEVGIEALRAMLARGIAATLAAGGAADALPHFAFIGLPAYGEDSALTPVLDGAATPALAQERYRCGNDMVCGWAGALGCADGISVVAGTGTIAYGEFGGRRARAGGWGELFSDEGSAYWVAREGLTLFSRMSDGREPRGVLYAILREHFALRTDLDLCASIYGPDFAQRSQLATLAPLVARAAGAGDTAARALFARVTDELVQLINAVRRELQVPDAAGLPVSYSGGMFTLRELVLQPLRQALGSGAAACRFVEPLLPPGIGAAMYAAKLAGTPLSAAALTALQGGRHAQPG
jgi:N-acetylglucosamine kinase-like BadF-type ATPase